MVFVCMKFTAQETNRLKRFKPNPTSTGPRSSNERVDRWTEIDITSLVSNIWNPYVNSYFSIFPTHSTSQQTLSTRKLEDHRFLSFSSSVSPRVSSSCQPNHLLLSTTTVLPRPCCRAARLVILSLLSFSWLLLLPLSLDFLVSIATLWPQLSFRAVIKHTPSIALGTIPCLHTSLIVYLPLTSYAHLSVTPYQPPTPVLLESQILSLLQAFCLALSWGSLIVLFLTRISPHGCSDLLWLLKESFLHASSVSIVLFLTLLVDLSLM